MTFAATSSLPARPPTRRSLATSLWAMFVLALRQHLHGKRWIIMTILFLLPTGLAILVRSTAPDAPAVGMEFALAFMFIPQAILPLVALVYASGITQDEQEEQTFTYLLIRPIPKWALYLAKLFATLTTTVVLTSFFTALTFIAIYAGRDNSGLHLLHRYAVAASIHSLSVIAYCCLFGLMGLVTNRPLIVGILYIAIFEGLFGNLPFGIRLVTVIYYARLIAFRSLQFLDITPRGAENIAADAWQFDVQNDPLLLEHPSMHACLEVLLIGSLVGALLAAFLCSRKEFHVKTPEKGGN